MIKAKEGKCIDCGFDAADKPLMAKRCFTAPFFHYQKHQQAKYIAKSSERKKAKNDRIKSANNGMTLGKWFNEQISIMPSYCENCNEFLSRWSAPWSLRGYVAHIVPKRQFESVAVHPLNRMFLCIDCHTKFDNSLSREIIKMKCWPIAVERFNQFKHDISFEEIKHLQPCLSDIY